MNETSAVPEPRIIETLSERPGHQKYPWQEWGVLDGKARVFERGVHYHGTSRQFVHAANNWASRRGYRTLMRSRPEFCELQFVPIRVRGRAPKAPDAE